MSFCPSEIAAEIKKHIPEFEITYKPDFRQSIASSWPKSINDSVARLDWGWEPSFGLEEMTEDILKNLPAVCQPAIQIVLDFVYNTEEADNLRVGN